MLLEISSYSQFRIGICIAMIILLLGVVSVYTIKTMEEINQNSNYHVEFSQKILNLDNIKIKYEKQIIVFEKLKSEKNYNGAIESTLKDVEQPITNRI